MAMRLFPSELPFPLCVTLDETTTSLKCFKWVSRFTTLKSLVEPLE